MKKIVFIVAFILCFVSCSKWDKHYGTSYSEGGLTLTSSVSSPDYVGGVTVYINVSNNTGKTIKYISIAGDMRNVFDDNVRCEITNNIGMSINITGPIYNGANVTYESGDCFYNPNATKYCINDVDVTYL